MAVTVLKPSRDLLLGDTWVIDVEVTDFDGCPAADAVTVTVTLPDGTTSSPAVDERDTLGGYRATVTADMAGRWVAAAVGAAYGAAAATAYITAVVTGVAMPTITDVDNYLGTHSFTDDDLAEALAAETDAQRRACRIPADYPNDLRRALIRRAARALALKRINIDTEVDGETGRSIVPPGLDREIRRYEGPYRRLVTG